MGMMAAALGAVLKRLIAALKTISLYVFVCTTAIAGHLHHHCRHRYRRHRRHRSVIINKIPIDSQHSEPSIIVRQPTNQSSALFTANNNNNSTNEDSSSSSSDNYYQNHILLVEKMQPSSSTKRSLTLVIASLLVVAAVTVTEAAAPVITVDPEWINYGQSASVTVTFDPPCPLVSIWRRGMDAGYPDTCVFGPSCPNNGVRPATVQVSFNTAGNWMRFTGVNAMANGRYYARCPAAGADGEPTMHEGTIAIGVKPRILAVEFGSPQYGVQVNLTRWQGDKVVPWNSPFDNTSLATVFKSDHALPLPLGESYLTLTIGMGVDPHTQAPQATSPKLFTFEAPDFDENPNLPREMLGEFLPIANFPMATRIRYRLNRNWLASIRQCSIKSLAVATLTSERQDRAEIALDFEFDPTVANITAKQIGITEEAPIGRSCDCLFTCQVGSCPMSPSPYDYEWSFPSLLDVSNTLNAIEVNKELAQKQQQQQLSPNISRTTFVPGNVVGYPHLYLLNASACLELYTMARDLMRTQHPLPIICRVNGGLVPANRREVKFYDFMARSFRDECKSYRRAESTGDGRHE